MTFGQPLWFWAFALLPVLIVLFFLNESRRGKLLRRLVAARLQDRLAGSVSVGKRRFRFLLILLGLACVIGALVQPRLGYIWEKSERKGRDVLLAIDCSKSMLATDLAPSRLVRAKLAAQDLLGQLGGDRAGLIAFAGSAFLQAPLTVDYSAVLNSLTELDTEIIPLGGSNIAAAIKQAVEAFGKGESENRALIIFTDGEELDDDAVKAAAALNGAVRIYTIGIGSADGSLIPVPGAAGGTEFVKDQNGQFVKSRLDEDRLRKIAESTGGFYIRLESGPAETLQIVREGLAQMKEQDLDAKMSRRPIERYQWPLAAGLVLLASSMLVGERKRSARRTAVPAKSAARSAAVAVLLVAGGFAPTGAWAKNAGVEAYEREDYKGAAEVFTKQLKRMPGSEALHFNQGATAYKQRDYSQALEAFAKAVTSPDPQLRAAAEYNLGNTLYQRGAGQKDKAPKIKEWKNALQHYDQALNVQPANQEAKYNRDLVQRLIDELEKEPPKSDDKKPEDKKDENKKDEDKKQPKSGEDKNDQKQNPQDQKQDQQQQKPGDEQQPQNQDKPGEQKSDQEGKDDKKDGKQGDSPEAKGDQGKEKDDKKDGGENPQEQGEPKNGEPNKDGTKGEQPKPDPNQPDRKLAGDIKPKNEQPAQPTPQQQEAAQEAAEAQAAEEGKMTEAQAKGLLDSLKGEDSRVQLLKPGERKAGGRVLRDW